MSWSCLENICLRTSHPQIAAGGRFFGLSAGDWTVLIGGFGFSALAVFLL